MGASDPDLLSVAPLSKTQEAELFAQLFSAEVAPRYPESRGYAERILDIHARGGDPYGYLTRTKKIWMYLLNGLAIGFSVATEKHGGSIKFGPTAMMPAMRGHGLGSRYKLLVEREYPMARKFYSTTPEDNIPAIKSAIKCGYRIEAHLERQYSASSADIVVGKLVKQSSYTKISRPRVAKGCPYRVSDIRGMNVQEVERIVINLLSRWYDEIDALFVRGLLAGVNVNSVDLNHKAKRVGVALQDGIATGIIVVTPKRGGALKCSPLIAGSSVCARLLLRFARESFKARDSHKLYLHLPLSASFLVQECLRLNFHPEGILREPYKRGVDMIVMGKTE
jgi:RimJ/RimL family protein N-acetyltransferase